MSLEKSDGRARESRRVVRRGSDENDRDASGSAALSAGFEARPINDSHLAIEQPYGFAPKDSDNDVQPLAKKAKLQDPSTKLSDVLPSEVCLARVLTHC